MFLINSKICQAFLPDLNFSTSLFKIQKLFDLKDQKKIAT